MYKLTCPSCKKFLRSATPIPAGKRVKCPGCATLFEAPAEQMEAQQPALSPAGQAHGFATGRAPQHPTPPYSTPQYPAGSYSTQPQPSPPPAYAHASFGFDQPAGGGMVNTSIRRPKKSRLGLILGLSFAGVALLTGVVVAVVLMSRNSGGGAAAQVAVEDLVSYVPDNSQIIIGVDANQMRGSSPNWRQELQKVEQQAGVPIPAELVEQLQLAVVGLAIDPKQVNRTPQATITFTFNKPYDKDLVKRTLQITGSQQVEGKEIHTAQKGMDKLSVAFVTDTKVVAGTAEPKDFHKLVFGAAPKRPTAEVLAEVNRVKTRGFWVVADVSGFTKDVPPPPANMGIMPINGLPQMLDAVKSSKAISLTFDMPVRAGNLNVSAAVVCANNADANNLSQSLNANWNNFKPLLGMMANPGLGGGMPGQPNFGPAIDDLNKTMNIRADGNRAIAELSLSQASIKALEEAGNGFNPGGFGPPPAINPPGFNPVVPKGFPKKVGKK